jgi:hypothetical protein
VYGKATSQFGELRLPQAAPGGQWPVAGDHAELVTLADVDHFASIDPRSEAFGATRAATLRLLGI